MVYHGGHDSLYQIGQTAVIPFSKKREIERGRLLGNQCLLGKQAEIYHVYCARGPFAAQILKDHNGGNEKDDGFKKLQTKYV